MRPNAARDAQDEQPVVEPNGSRAVGDARSNRVPPDLRRNRWPYSGKPILPGARENGPERFRRRHRRARSFHGQSRPLGADFRTITSGLRFSGLMFYHFRADSSSAGLSVICPSGATASKVAPRRSVVPAWTVPSARRTAYVAPARGTDSPSATT